MKNFYVIILLLIVINASAQSDVLQLKKRNYIIKSFMSGQVFTFKMKDNWTTAIIRRIQNDSLYIQPFYMRYSGGGNSLILADTIYSQQFSISPKQIQALPKEKSFGFIRNGSLFMLGGGGYLALNIINTISDNKPVFGSDNITRAGIAAGVVALGAILHFTNSAEYKMGRKYSLAYLNLGR